MSQRRRAVRSTDPPAKPRPTDPRGFDPDLSRRILQVFTVHAYVSGLRGVVLAEVAAEVGVTLATLRRLFPTKADLVQALVESWVAAVRDSVDKGSRRRLDARELLRWWTDAWATGLGRFSPAFWKELEADYPKAWTQFAATRDQVYEVRARVRRGFRRGVRADVASELYEIALAHFNDPEVCERLGLARRDAVNAAVEIWMGGALPPVTNRRG